MSVTWKIDCVDVWTRDGKQDVVDAVWYTVTCEDGGATAVRQGSVGIPYDPNASFKALSALSEADMIAWVQGVINGALVDTEAGLTNVEKLELQLMRQTTARRIAPPAIEARLATEAAAAIAARG